MNIEVFVAVLAALVAYRLLLPIIDLVNPLSVLNKSKGVHVIHGIAGGPKVGAGRGQ